MLSRDCCIQIQQKNQCSLKTVDGHQKDGKSDKFPWLISETVSIFIYLSDKASKDKLCL